MAPGGAQGASGPAKFSVRGPNASVMRPDRRRACQRHRSCSRRSQRNEWVAVTHFLWPQGLLQRAHSNREAIQMLPFGLWQRVAEVRAGCAPSVATFDCCSFAFLHHVQQIAPLCSCQIPLSAVPTLWERPRAVSLSWGAGASSRHSPLGSGGAHQVSSPRSNPALCPPRMSLTRPSQ